MKAIPDYLDLLDLGRNSWSEAGSEEGEWAGSCQSEGYFDRRNFGCFVDFEEVAWGAPSHCSRLSYGRRTCGF